MIIIPAIDLLDCQCVRLHKGKISEKIEYDRNPISVAKYFEEIGAKRIHIIDLNGAIEGERKNNDIIKEISQNVDIEIETGGGIRTLDNIKNVLTGIDFVILGTSAINDEHFLDQVLEKYGEKIIVSVDSKSGYIMKNGWTKGTDIKTIDFVNKLEEKGVKTIVLTDTLKDGTLTGVNIDLVKEILRETKMKIIVAGGVSSLEDIIKIKNLNNKNIKGVIIGKAYYDGKINIEKAIEVTKNDC